MANYKFSPKYFVFKAQDKLVLPVETDKNLMLIDVWSISSDKFENVSIKGKIVRGEMTQGIKIGNDFVFKDEKVSIKKDKILKEGVLKIIDYKDRYYFVDENGLVIGSPFDSDALIRKV